MSTTTQVVPDLRPPDLRGPLTVLLAVCALPLVLGWAAAQLVSPRVAARRWYWVSTWWHAPAAAAGAAIGSAAVVWQWVAVARWFGDGRAFAFVAGGAAATVGRVPAGLVGLLPRVGLLAAAGLCATPAFWLTRRRRTARMVAMRQLPSALDQEQAERARAQAADWSAARRIGVEVDPRTGQGTDAGRARWRAPHEVGARVAFGVVARPTVRTLVERQVDVRRVLEWVDGSGRWVLLPELASHVRALVVAESGPGRTVLLTDLVLCAAARRWPVVVIDAKGDEAGAHDLAARVQAAAGSASVAPRWNLFAGTGAQITGKIMRLLPEPNGANQHYLDETRLVLDLVQDRSALRSVLDLRTRLATPEPWVTDPADLRLLTAEDRSGQTVGSRVWQSLAAALRPLTPFLAEDGWSFENLPADVTVVPLSPADAAQARLGDLMLADHRRWLSDRLAAGDRSPALIVVDELPLLGSGAIDPGDIAEALFETTRSAGAGLVLAAQSVSGPAGDETHRRRALASGAALIIGRSEDPEDVVRTAGAVVRTRSAGAAADDQLRSGSRAQRAWAIAPQAVREAWDGAFWLVQAGGVVAFRAMPAIQVPTAAEIVDEPAPGMSVVARDDGSAAWNRQMSTRRGGTTR